MLLEAEVLFFKELVFQGVVKYISKIYPPIQASNTGFGALQNFKDPLFWARFMEIKKKKTLNALFFRHLQSGAIAL